MKFKLSYYKSPVSSSVRQTETSPGLSFLTLRNLNYLKLTFDKWYSLNKGLYSKCNVLSSSVSNLGFFSVIKFQFLSENILEGFKRLESILFLN